MKLQPWEYLDFQLSICSKTKIRCVIFLRVLLLLDYNLRIPLYYCNVGICRIIRIISCTHSWFMRPSIGPKMDELFPLPGMKS